MKEDKIQVFLEGVQNYFYKIMPPEELVIGTPYLVENTTPSAKDFTGVIAIAGKHQGIVYFTAPKELLTRLLLLMGESNVSEEYMIDLVGEIANTVAGNARHQFGDEFEISVPVVLRGAPDEILLPRKDRSFVIPLHWKTRSAAIVVCVHKG